MARFQLFLMVLLGAGSAAASNAADPAGSRPRNVLFIAADDMRPWLGCYGHPQAKTPHLDQFAASGVRFSSAHVQYALCFPSRTSMLSGCRPDEEGRNWFIGRGSPGPQYRSIRQARPGIVSLPEHLRNHGWRTIAIGKIGHDWDKDGFDELRFGPDEGSLGYYELPESLTQIKREGLPERGIPYEAADMPDAGYNDGKMAREAAQTLRALAKSGQRFFLGVGFWRPHMPLICPEKYWGMYPAAEVIIPTNLALPHDVGPLAPISGPAQVNWKNYRLPQKPDGSLEEWHMRESIRGYLACNSFVDAQVGIVLEALEATGLARDTLVIFWSDHGYHLGEHGEWSKMTVYEEATRVPLIIRDPSAPHASTVIEQPVESLDIFPTVCDLLGLEPPSHLEGESLRPLLRGEPGRNKDHAVTIVHRGGKERWILKPEERWDAVAWSLRTPTHRYTVWLDAETKRPLQRELFDRSADPGENTNLAADPAHAATLQALHERLMQGVIEPHRRIAAAATAGGD